MKGFAIVLLCAVAAIQGRSVSVNEVVSQQSAAALGENPWVVHLRLAVGTSGFLESCVGALIDSRWVLTTALCVRDGRFVWIRLGAPNVISPERVYESSDTRPHSEYDFASGSNNIALISVNRDVDLSANIAPIALSSPSGDLNFGAQGNYCGYGQADQDAVVVAGEQQSCWDVVVVGISDSNVLVHGQNGISNTRADAGAPLVSEGRLVGLLTGVVAGFPDMAGFINVGAYVNWISGMTGVDFSSAARVPDMPQDIIIVN